MRGSGPTVSGPISGPSHGAYAVRQYNAGVEAERGAGSFPTARSVLSPKNAERRSPPLLVRSPFPDPLLRVMPGFRMAPDSGSCVAGRLIGALA